MTVLTICNHGTGFNRVKGPAAGELVGWTHANIHGTESRMDDGTFVPGNHIVNDGPGAPKNDVALASTVNPVTGRQKSEEHTSRSILGRRAVKNDFLGQGGSHQTGFLADKRGNISGMGWNENIHRTMHLLQLLKFEHGVNITTINMVGWSRGAVTSIRLANKIDEVFNGTIPMNIFSVDPVAGQSAGLKMADTQILPPSVKNYVAILAMNEMRRTFAPQDMSRMRVTDPNSTRMTFLPMPGQHNQQVMSRSGVSQEPQARISMTLAYAFLRQFGTRFNGPPAHNYASNSHMARAYARIVKRRPGYKDSSGIGSRLVGMGLGRRDFAKKANMASYVTGGKGSYWVNEHHRHCFKHAFPATYQAIFHGSHSPHAGHLMRVPPGELATMNGSTGSIIKTLASQGYLESGQIIRGSGSMRAMTSGNQWPSVLHSHG